MPTRLDHLIVRVNDVEKSAEFYTSILGLTAEGSFTGTILMPDRSQGDAARVGAGKEALGPAMLVHAMSSPTRRSAAAVAERSNTILSDDRAIGSSRSHVCACSTIWATRRSTPRR